MGSSLSSLVFQPPEVTYQNASKHIIWIQTPIGSQIPAFHINRKSKYTILFSHGNAEDIGMIFEWFCELSAALNVNILAYDYEGYGKAPGCPSEEACYRDIMAAYDYLTTHLNCPPENVIIYGRSLGSGPSIFLARKLSQDGMPVAGLILQCPILSIYRVAFNFRFTLPGDIFPNIDRISEVTCPVFIIHGTRDEVVPFWNGEDLFFSVPVKWRAKPFWVDGAGHNNIEILLKESGMFVTKVRDFLEEWVPGYRETVSHRVHPKNSNKK